MRPAETTDGDDADAVVGRPAAPAPSAALPEVPRPHVPPPTPPPLASRHDLRTAAAAAERQLNEPDADQRP
ncbi:hypothetical protein THAOC_23421, partial [Thalassiosira oceanica]